MRKVYRLVVALVALGSYTDLRRPYRYHLPPGMSLLLPFLTDRSLDVYVDPKQTEG